VYLLSWNLLIIGLAPRGEIPSSGGEILTNAERRNLIIRRINSDKPRALVFPHLLRIYA
jgi:hypothetical protein